MYESIRGNVSEAERMAVTVRCGDEIMCILVKFVGLAIGYIWEQTAVAFCKGLEESLQPLFDIADAYAEIQTLVKEGF